MLIQFSVSNFRSFLNEESLSLESTSISDYPKNVAKTGKMKLNKCAVIYGANASGKSNFLQAMGLMKTFLFDSFEQSSSGHLDFDPFLLKEGNSNIPTTVEIVFLIDNTQYRYGFESNETEILGEWLFEMEKRTEKPLFVRSKDGIEVFKHFSEGIQLEEKTRKNALFLTVVDKFNGSKSSRILNWFNNFNVINGLSHNNYRSITYEMLDLKETRDALMNFYKELDLGFETIRVNKEIFNAEKMISGFPEDLIKQIVTDLEGETMVNITSVHRMFDEDFNFTDSFKEFNVRRQESSGTNKIIDLSGPIFDTLRDGGVLVVDELDAKLHPLMTFAIIRLFQNETTNRKNAQLIFATHSTNILSIGHLRRDQIYFTEKNNLGISNLYSLVEYNMQGKKVRKDNSFEKDYIKGRYGAIPQLGNFNKYDSKWLEK